MDSRQYGEYFVVEGSRRLYIFFFICKTESSEEINIPPISSPFKDGGEDVL